MITFPVRHPLRRGGAVVGTAVALALLAGCGGGGSGSGGGLPDVLSPLGGKSPAQIARDARDFTRAAGTSRFAVDMEMQSTGGIAAELGGEYETPMVMTGEGTYDFGRQIGDGRMSSSGGGIPAALVNRPVGQYDPSQQLDLLRGVSDDVREVGTDQVRGAHVRHFAVTIDPQKLAAETGVGVDRGLVQDALRSLGPIPADVFVDDDGRVRRLDVRMTVEGADVELPGLTDDPAVQQVLQACARRRGSRSSTSTSGSP